VYGWSFGPLGSDRPVGSGRHGSAAGLSMSLKHETTLMNCFAQGSRVGVSTKSRPRRMVAVHGRTKESSWDTSRQNSQSTSTYSARALGCGE
jgi:hypothetical protein